MNTASSFNHFICDSMEPSEMFNTIGGIVFNKNPKTKCRIVHQAESNRSIRNSFPLHFFKTPQAK